MNIKKLTLATVVGGFGMWVLSGLWHNLIVPAFYSQTGASHEGIGILLVAYLVLSLLLLMAYMYPLGYQGGRPIIEGLRS
ncbi:MAG TPA: hypothetical protein VEC93_04285 [Anaerolineae bacterium]|nr:hypothetical protein [Anaerolineae bacterium]